MPAGPRDTGPGPLTALRRTEAPIALLHAPCVRACGIPQSLVVIGLPVARLLVPARRTEISSIMAVIAEMRLVKAQKYGSNSSRLRRPGNNGTSARLPTD